MKTKTKLKPTEKKAANPQIQQGWTIVAQLRQATANIEQYPFMVAVVDSANRFTGMLEDVLRWAEAEQETKPGIEKVENGRAKPHGQDAPDDDLLIDLDEFDPTVTYSEDQIAKFLEQSDEWLTSDNPQHVAFAQAVILNLRYHVALTVNRSLDEFSGEISVEWLNLVGEQTDEELEAFWFERIDNAYRAVEAIAAAFGLAITENHLQLPGYVDPSLSDDELFRLIMGNVEIRFHPEISSEDGFAGKVAPGDNVTLINFYKVLAAGGGDYIPTVNNIIHEFGHVLDWRVGGYARTRVEDEPILSDNTAFIPGHEVYERNYEGFLSGFDFQNQSNLPGEDWADSFLAWVTGQFDPSHNRQAIFEDWLADAISISYGRGLGSDAMRVFIEESGYATFPVNIPSSENISLQEMPYDYHYIPTLWETGDVTVNIIGQVETPVYYTANQSWMLAEVNGIIGFIPREDIPRSDIPNTPATITPEMVEELTGRLYTTERAAPVYVEVLLFNQDGSPRINQVTGLQETNWITTDEILGYHWDRVRNMTGN